jgi:hypothetical protein
MDPLVLLWLSQLVDKTKVSLDTSCKPSEIPAAPLTPGELLSGSATRTILLLETISGRMRYVPSCFR